MKKTVKFLILLSMILIFSILLQTKSYAKSYTIDYMDLQVTIEENGDARIVQTMMYSFNGSYNGVYITVPYNLTDVEANDVIKNKKINDMLYNGNQVKVNDVSVVSGTSEKHFIAKPYAVNGDNGVYKIDSQNGKYEIKLYSPSTNTSKIFKVDYTIRNLCVRHNDVGELYYNFIGGNWDVPIAKLNIDVHLPKNNSQIYIWGHGPYSGVSEIISPKRVNFKVNNILKGQYVATRIMFDLSNIPESDKVSGISAKNIILADEQAIFENRENKDKFTLRVLIVAIVLLIYWIILMLIFEKDKKYPISSLNEDELFDKYNPMVAGCLQGSRDILARDIIAVILELVNKKILTLEFTHNAKRKRNIYIYNYKKYRKRFRNG